MLPLRTFTLVNYSCKVFIKSIPEEGKELDLFRHLLVYFKSLYAYMEPFKSALTSLRSGSIRLQTIIKLFTVVIISVS